MKSKMWSDYYQAVIRNSCKNVAVVIPDTCVLQLHIVEDRSLEV